MSMLTKLYLVEEVEGLKSELAIAKSFYDLTLAERNYERVRNDRLTAENERLAEQLRVVRHKEAKEAKQAAWQARNLGLCQCDHNQYCEHCFPADFRPGGIYAEKKP